VSAAICVLAFGVGVLGDVRSKPETLNPRP
jgi:hypothetical protein